MSLEKERLLDALQLLWAAHGYPERDGDDDILGVLIRTVLSQSTSNENSRRAFASLVDTFHGDWSQVENAAVEDVAESIVIGGLSNQKAPRIQAIVARARTDSPSGEYSLEHLRETPAEDAHRYLESLPGVGPKTARFTLMYAAGADMFPMDTHIFRILERLEVLEPTLSDRTAHRVAESMMPAGDAYAAHMTLVKHGREVCHARSPVCGGCTVNRICPSARTAPN